MIPRVHVVTDDTVLARADFEVRALELCEFLRGNGGAAREPGVVALHLRGPRTPARRLAGLARRLCQAAEGAGIRFLVNDRVDVALAARASGVHLGGRSIPPGDARRLLGRGRFVGVSVHGLAEAEEVRDSGADYLFLGALFETPSHPEAETRGLEGLGAVAARVALPVVGIGGVTPERASDAVAAGAHGVAAVRGVWDAPSPPEAVQAYVDAVKRSIREEASDSHG